MNIKNNKLVNYVRDSYFEMKKVTWPTRKETTKLTTIVIIISISVAAFLGLLDYIFSSGVKEIIIAKGDPKKIESPVQVNAGESTVVPEDIDFGLNLGDSQEQGSAKESNQ